MSWARIRARSSTAGLCRRAFSSGVAGAAASPSDPVRQPMSKRGGEGVRPMPEMAGVVEAAHPPQLPVDEASLDEVHPDAWQHKITPDAFYEEVKADPRQRDAWRRP